MNYTIPLLKIIHHITQKVLEHVSVQKDTNFLMFRNNPTINRIMDNAYNITISTANAEADANELKAIEKVFVKDKPIKIGSVVSNMGHGEPASGACALTKVNLHAI